MIVLKEYMLIYIMCIQPFFDSITILTLNMKRYLRNKISKNLNDSFLDPIKVPYSSFSL